MPDVKSTETGEIERADGGSINEMADKAAAHDIPVLYIGTRYNPETQFVSKDGGTVYNILPSDPRMEAIHGERKYTPRDMDTLAKKQADKIDELEAKLNALALATASAPAVKPAASGGMDYGTLIKIAKRLDPTIKGRPSVAKLRAIVFGEPVEGNEEEIAEAEGSN